MQTSLRPAHRLQAVLRCLVIRQRERRTRRHRSSGSNAGLRPFQRRSPRAGESQFARRLRRHPDETCSESAVSTLTRLQRTLWTTGEPGHRGRRRLGRFASEIVQRPQASGHGCGRSAHRCASCPFATTARELVNGRVERIDAGAEAAALYQAALTVEQSDERAVAAGGRGRIGRLHSLARSLLGRQLEQAARLERHGLDVHDPDTRLAWTIGIDEDARDAHARADGRPATAVRS